MVQYLEGNNGVEKGNINRAKTSDAMYNNSYYKESNKYNICKTIIEFGKRNVNRTKKSYARHVTISVGRQYKESNK